MGLKYLLRFCNRSTRKMNDVHCFAVFLLLASMTMWLLYETDYQNDFNRWDNTLQKRDFLLKEFETSRGSIGQSASLDLYPLDGSSSLTESENEAGSDSDSAAASSTEDDWANAPVVSKLERSLANVEEDVLHLDVRLILRTISAARLEENRLVHKLQNAQLHPWERCVIRITKYCGTRCTHLFGNYSREWNRFTCSFASPCNVETRFVGQLTDDIMSSTDVLIIVASLHESLQLEDLMARRPPGQLWMLYSRESPQHDPEYDPPKGVYNPYNLTMTYAIDSDMYFPYCHTHRYPVSRLAPLPKKTKLMAWMASNCHRLSWRRNELVDELRKHLSIDTYGKCGEYGPLPDSRATKTLQQYKFYLALENSECRDYITEKVWRTSLPNGIIPVVYGASRRDYEQILPSRSFIHLEDFGSMAEFVDYINALDSNDALYERFFDWRKENKVVCHSARLFVMLSPEVNFCYLLKKLVHVYLNPETSWQRKFPDFRIWWSDSCSDPVIPKDVLGFNVHQPKRKPRNVHTGRDRDKL